MAELIYLFCALTSVVCASMLYRAYRSTPSRLLFWSSACFWGLALNNILLFVDLVLVPEVDLSFVRNVVALASMLVLLYGLIWEAL
jgi:hypothetical protein